MRGRVDRTTLTADWTSSCWRSFNVSVSSVCLFPLRRTREVGVYVSDLLFLVDVNSMSDALVSYLRV